LVEGTLWKVGTADPEFNIGLGRDYKQIPQALYCGQKVLTDISGPGSHIVTSTTDYTYCRSFAAGECRNGGDTGGASAVGYEYLNCPIVTANWCRGGEAYTGHNDQCVGNLMMYGSSSAVQFRIPTPASATTIIPSGPVYARTLGKVFHRPREGSSNAKPLLDGSWIMAPGLSKIIGLNLSLMKNPGMPPLQSIRRDTWQMVQVKVTPPVGLAVNNAVVEFGYDPNLRCGPRNEACIVGAPGADPFYFRDTETYSGVACSPSCTIGIPSLPSRVLYYRWTYRDSGNATLAQSTIEKIAVQ
jgi:hypothetical protein